MFVIDKKGKIKKNSFPRAFLPTVSSDNVIFNLSSFHAFDTKLRLNNKINLDNFPIMLQDFFIINSSENWK